MAVIEIYMPPELPISRLRGISIMLARKAAGLTVVDMAAKLHRSKDTVHRWERGVVCPDLDEARAIADVLGQPMGFLE
jgi:ribosome-binding protein aMBF1 (putative translation factor)